ncbi:MAG TPA: hypothetical protein VGM60_05490 [Pseudonocardia sp.]|jgi:negative regulator of replication initiation|uniref:hypothetical protein n=1 Tax=Pseudonocardia sp. TaxID=60912 RepID=UPI002F41F94F
MSTQPGKSSAIENTVERIRELNDRIVTSAKSSGNEAIETYERMLENLAEAQEAAGDRGAEWVKEFARAQAAFTRQLAQAFPNLLERLTSRGKEIGDVAGDQLRRVPGVSRAENLAKGSLAREDELPVANYDDLNVNEISDRLETLSNVDLDKIEAYETRTKNRKTVHDKISALRD